MTNQPLPIMIYRWALRSTSRDDLQRTVRARSQRSVISTLFAMVVCVTLVGTLRASVASAHASVSSTSPEAGATVAESPREVTITFDQGISVPNGGVRVLNERAERIGAEKPRIGSKADRANTVSVAIPTLPSGAYVVSWRAISEDGHPIRGAFTFRVGASGDQAAVAKLARDLLTNGKADPALSMIMAAARAMIFASMLVLLGGVAYVLFVRSQASGNDRRVSRLLTGAAITAGTFGFITVLTFGPSSAGEGLGSLGDGTLLDDTITSSIGRSMLLRTVALATLGFVLVRVLSGDRIGAGIDRATNHNVASANPTGNEATGASTTMPSKARYRTSEVIGLTGLSILILMLSTLIGHGSTGRWGLLGTVATAAHIAAASTWIGLLVVVLVATSGSRSPIQGATETDDRPKTPSKPSAPPTTKGVLSLIERFSPIAFWSVAILALSGILNGLRQIGSTEGLRSTNYGRLLLAKTGLVVLLIGLGWLSRNSLAQRRAALAQRAAQTSAEPETHKPLPPALVGIRRRMLIESLLAVGVVAITALLVNSPPSIEVLGKPVTVTMRGTTFLLDSTVSPARSGKNRLHFYALTPEGRTQAVENMTVTASLPANDIAPIDLKVVRAGPNHFEALQADLPVKGPWRFIVEVQFDAFTAESVAATVNIR